MVAAEAVEEAGGAEHERARADRRGEAGALVRVADPVEDALVVLEGAGADAAGEDDDVGLGHLLERGVGLQAEHRVLGAHLAAGVARRR